MTSIEIVKSVDEDMFLVEEGKRRGVAAIPVIPVEEGIRIIRVPNGCTSGKSSVFIQVPLPDGRFVMAQITAANFQMAASALRGWDQGDAERGAAG